MTTKTIKLIKCLLFVDFSKRELEHVIHRSPKGKEVGAGSGIVESQLFMASSILFLSYSLLTIEILFVIHFFSLEVGRIYIRYSLRKP